MNKKASELKFKDELMAEMDKKWLPKNFKQWILEKIYKNHYYMFFKIQDKHHLGSCQHCKNEDIELGNVKSAQSGKCPICGKRVKYRNLKHSQIVNDKSFASILFKTTDGGFCLRRFMVIKKNNFLKYKLYTYEVERFYVNKEKDLKKYFHSVYDYQTCSYSKWNNGNFKNMSYSYPDSMWIYAKNLKTVLNNTCFKFCQLDKLALKSEVDAINYLIYYNKYPQLEYLIKLKLFNLAENIYTDYYGSDKEYLQLNAKKLKDFLKIKSNENINYIIKRNVNMNILKIIQVCDKLNLKYNTNILDFLNANRFYNLSNFETDSGIFLNYIPLLGLLNYAIKQKAYINKQTNYCYFINDYIDYIKACEFLKYNLNDTMILKPNHFKEAHDKVLKIKQDLYNKNKNKLLEKVLKDYNKLFSITDKDFSIIVPKNNKDFIEEGKKQDNCVATYIERVINKTSIVLFVRNSKQSNKSLYTLEICPNTYEIVQLRAKHNESAPENVVEWVNRKLNKIKQKLSVV